MNMDNLMDNIRSFFLDQYKGMNKDHSFISFEPLGTIIDPADFVGDTDDISNIKATEQLSILGDRLSQIDEVFIPNSNHLSTVYETLISSAAFTNIKITTPDIGPYMAQFGEKKGIALQKIQDGKKASIQTPEGNYLPVYAIPQKWYDASGNFWQEKNFNVGDNSTTPTPTTPNPSKKPLPLGWRNKIVIDQKTLTNINNAIINKKLNIAPNILQQITTLKTVNTINATDNTKIQPSIDPAINKNRIQPMRNFTPINNSSTTPLVKDNNIQPVKIDSVGLFKNRALFNNVKLSDRIKLTNILLDKDETKPVATNNFSMSFKYCIAYLNRPWFDSTLFAFSRMWYGLSLQENFFSNGENNESNQGMMKCIPTAMILIKDLKIKASWTDEDKKNAENSISLGIFNIEDNHIIQNELSNNGIQIIGWICDVMPKLPAISDPNFV